MFSAKIEHVETIDQVSTEELVDPIREIVANGGVDLEALFDDTGINTGKNNTKLDQERH